MKKIFTALLIAACAFSSTSQAQTGDPKQEWATKVVALQQGADLDNLVAQLANNVTQELIAAWGPKFDAGVSKARQAKATEELNAELAKFVVDAKKIIGGQVSRVSVETLVPAYTARFSLEELKQLAAFFESPVVKKYKEMTPDLVNVFVGKLIEVTQTDIQARVTQFDAAATRIIGPAAPAAKPATK
jgi:hypothetical protein